MSEEPFRVSDPIFLRGQSGCQWRKKRSPAARSYSRGRWFWPYMILERWIRRKGGLHTGSNMVNVPRHEAYTLSFGKLNGVLADIAFSREMWISEANAGHGIWPDPLSISWNTRDAIARHIRQSVDGMCGLFYEGKLLVWPSDDPNSRVLFGLCRLIEESLDSEGKAKIN